MAKKLSPDQQIGLEEEILNQFGDHDSQTDFSHSRLEVTGNHFTSPRCRHCTTHNCIDNGPKCKEYRSTAIK